jgi:hypothetical protein
MYFLHVASTMNPPLYATVNLSLIPRKATEDMKKEDFNDRMERFEVLKALNLSAKSERHLGITIH